MFSLILPRETEWGWPIEVLFPRHDVSFGFKSVLNIVNKTGIMRDYRNIFSRA